MIDILRFSRTDSLSQLAEHCKAVWLSSFADKRPGPQSWERKTLNDRKVQVGACFSNSQESFVKKKHCGLKVRTRPTKTNHGQPYFLEKKQQHFCSINKAFFFGGGAFLGSSCSRIHESSKMLSLIGALVGIFVWWESPHAAGAAANQAEQEQSRFGERKGTGGIYRPRCSMHQKYIHDLYIKMPLKVMPTCR